MKTMMTESVVVVAQWVAQGLPRNGGASRKALRKRSVGITPSIAGFEGSGPEARIVKASIWCMYSTNGIARNHGARV